MDGIPGLCSQLLLHKTEMSQNNVRIKNIMRLPPTTFHPARSLQNLLQHSYLAEFESSSEKSSIFQPGPNSSNNAHKKKKIDDLFIM